jgi:signal recognition particle receptor subunit beta
MVQLLIAFIVLRSKRIPILFLANKTDIPNGMAPGDVSNALALEQIKDKNWYIWYVGKM